MSNTKKSVLPSIKGLSTIYVGELPLFSIIHNEDDNTFGWRTYTKVERKRADGTSRFSTETRRGLLSAQDALTSAIYSMTVWMVIGAEDVQRLSKRDFIQKERNFVKRDMSKDETYQHAQRIAIVLESPSEEPAKAKVLKKKA